MFIKKKCSIPFPISNFNLLYLLIPIFLVVFLGTWSFNIIYYNLPMSISQMRYTHKQNVLMSISQTHEYTYHMEYTRVTCKSARSRALYQPTFRGFVATDVQQKNVFCHFIFFFKNKILDTIIFFHFVCMSIFLSNICSFLIIFVDMSQNKSTNGRHWGKIGCCFLCHILVILSGISL